MLGSDLGTRQVQLTSGQHVEQGWTEKGPRDGPLKLTKSPGSPSHPLSCFLVLLNLSFFLSLFTHTLPLCACLVAQLVKNLPAVQKTWLQSLGWEDPLEKGKAIHSSILAWRIPWTA